MTDKIVVLVTCGSEEEAGRIARALVEQRLAACVNIAGRVRSLYRWEGKVADEAEVLLVIKTGREQFDVVRRAVERLHSYQVPEVICMPIIDAAPNYLNWMSGALAPARGGTPRAKPAPVRRGGRRKAR